MKVHIVDGAKHNAPTGPYPKLEDVLRRIPGLTVQIVHRATLFRLFFHIDDTKWLYPIGRAVSHNYGGWGFRVELDTCDVPGEAVAFCICGVAPGEHDLRRPPRRTKRGAGGELAARLNAVLDDAGVLRHFRLDPAQVAPLGGSLAVTEGAGAPRWVERVMYRQREDGLRLTVNGIMPERVVISWEPSRPFEVQEMEALNAALLDDHAPRNPTYKPYHWIRVPWARSLTDLQSVLDKLIPLRPPDPKAAFAALEARVAALERKVGSSRLG